MRESYLITMSLKANYNEKIKPELQKELGLKNVHAIPQLKKIVVNVGVGEAAINKHAIENVVADIQKITGQKPLICKARKSVSAFKIRVGLPIGVKVTLRGQRAYDFLEKLVTVVLPRVRDFKGLNASSLDGRGNLSIGLTDQTLFPEIEYDKIDKIRGLEISINTSAVDNMQALSFFKAIGIPFIVTDNQK